jgi:flavin-dependent dehydrogenase
MMFDVAVIGAGPAGSAAAKRCAEHGLETVLLEKKRLPRDKICSGMIIGLLAHTLIKEEFGEIPEAVLCRPSQLDGYMFHTPDAEGQNSKKLDFSISLTWRRNLDFWMTEKARSKGVQIWQGARVTGIAERKQGSLIRFQSGGENREIGARFVIGADGGTSIVRKCLFPQFKVPFNLAYEEWHQGSTEIDPAYFHWFLLREGFPGGFAVHQKDDFTVLEFGGTADVPKERVKWAKDYLATRYGFFPNETPYWRGACTVARLAGGLVAGAFLPAKRNVLLVGEAGGFVLPITGEGIGHCLESGILAAESIAQALKSNDRADAIYLTGIQPIIRAFKEYSHWIGRIAEAAKDNAGHLCETWAGAHQASLSIS